MLTTSKVNASPWTTVLWKWYEKYANAVMLRVKCVQFLMFWIYTGRCDGTKLFGKLTEQPPRKPWICLCKWILAERKWFNCIAIRQNIWITMINYSLHLLLTWWKHNNTRTDASPVVCCRSVKYPKVQHNLVETGSARQAIELRW